MAGGSGELGSGMQLESLSSLAGLTGLTEAMDPDAFMQALTNNPMLLQLSALGGLGGPGMSMLPLFAPGLSGLAAASALSAASSAAPAAADGQPPRKKRNVDPVSGVVHSIRTQHSALPSDGSSGSSSASSSSAGPAVYVPRLSASAENSKALMAQLSSMVQMLQSLDPNTLANLGVAPGTSLKQLATYPVLRTAMGIKESYAPLLDEENALVLPVFNSVRDAVLHEHTAQHQGDPEQPIVLGRTEFVQLFLNSAAASVAEGGLALPLGLRKSTPDVDLSPSAEAFRIPEDYLRMLTEPDTLTGQHPEAFLDDFAQAALQQLPAPVVRMTFKSSRALVPKGIVANKQGVALLGFTKESVDQALQPDHGDKVIWLVPTDAETRAATARAARAAGQKHFVFRGRFMRQDNESAASTAAASESGAHSPHMRFFEATEYACLDYETPFDAASGASGLPFVRSCTSYIINVRPLSGEEERAAQEAVAEHAAQVAASSAVSSSISDALAGFEQLAASPGTGSGHSSAATH